MLDECAYIHFGGQAARVVDAGSVQARGDKGLGHRAVTSLHQQVCLHGQRHLVDTVLVPLGSTESQLLRLLHALKKLARSARKRAHVVSAKKLPEFTHFNCLPADAYFTETEELPLMDSSVEATHNLVGRTCAYEIVLYSPGIPVLVPG